MTKKPRILTNEYPYHITLRGNNKQRTFSRNADYKYFLRLLSRYKEKYRFSLYHYVLMPNHLHLLLHLAEQVNIPKLMQGLTLSYFQYKNKRTGYCGHFWQGRYASKIIDTDRYLISAGLYIERNPVKAQIVALPEDYKWSSYRSYAYGENNPLIDTNPYYQNLGKNSDM